MILITLCEEQLLLVIIIHKGPETLKGQPPYCHMTSKELV